MGCNGDVEKAMDLKQYMISNGLSLICTYSGLCMELEVEVERAIEKAY
jgi:hypothetical protein